MPVLYAFNECSLFLLTGEIDTRFSFCAVATLALLVWILLYSNIIFNCIFWSFLQPFKVLNAYNKTFLCRASWMRSTWTRPLSLCCPVWTLMVGLVVGLVQSPMLVRWGVWGILFPPLNHISVFIHCKHMFFSSRLQIYCCTGFLSITGQLHQVNADLLGWWLCERQLPSGGLNGRPEKVRFPSDQWYYQILTN